MKANFLKILLLTVLSLLHTHVHAQGKRWIEKIEPENWWVNMAERQLQLMVYGKNIGNATVTLNSYAGVSLLASEKVENPNYLFLTLDIGPEAKPGTLILNFTNGKQKLRYDYKLLARRFPDNKVNGYHAGDLMYLIMPDRFANGNTANDSILGMQQQGINRKSDIARHGGDLAGISARMDYFKQLGVTTLWLNPVQENNQPKESYHGYAITDFYKIDPRFGTNADYVKLVNTAHQNGLKVIMDLVHNHCGNQHWFIRDLPTKDWVNQWPEFTRTSYRAITQIDPYGSEADRTLMRKGWFDTHMPDLNQQHPLLSKYLIQNNIWWVEYAGLNGFRLDTYAYADSEFMRSCMGAIRKQYPDIGIVGEVWVATVVESAFYTHGNKLNPAPETHLPGVTDFPLYDAIKDGLNEDFGWNTGLRRIYYVLAQDGLYGDASKNVIFLDNHDISRIWEVLRKDMAKMKMAHSLLLTLRGIPQLYYGSELLFGNYAAAGATNVRQDMPGGWPSDPVNKFDAQGRTADENEMFEHISRLANWRKNSTAIKDGAFAHYVPEDETYVFFRYTPESTVMVIAHTGKASRQIQTQRYNERISGFTKAVDVMSGQELSDLSTIRLQPMSVTILELKP